MSRRTSDVPGAHNAGAMGSTPMPATMVHDWELIYDRADEPTDYVISWCRRCGGLRTDFVDEETRAKFRFPYGVGPKCVVEPKP